MGALSQAASNFLDWITGGDDSEDTPTTAAASFSNHEEPITWSTTSSYRSGSDTGNNIGFDSTSDDFYIKMSRDTSKMIIRNTDGELAEFGPFIKFYESIVPSTRATLTLGSDSQMWAHVNSWALMAHSYIKIKSGAHSDSIVSDGEMWFDGSSVKIKSNGAVKNIDDIGGVADIAASWSSLTNDMIPATDGDYDIGSTSKRWERLRVSGFVHAGNINLTGGMTAQGNINTTGNITAADITASDDLRIVGDLDHEGNSVGFFGTTPASKYSGDLVKVTTTVNRLGVIPGLAGTAIYLMVYAIDELITIVQRYGLA